MYQYKVTVGRFYSGKKFITTNFDNNYRSYLKSKDESILTDQHKELIKAYKLDKTIDDDFELYSKLIEDDSEHRKWNLFISKLDFLDKKQKERYSNFSDINISPYVWHLFKNYDYPLFEDFREIGFFCDKLVLSFQIDLNEIPFEVFESKVNNYVEINGVPFEVMNTGIGYKNYCKLLKNNDMALSLVDAGSREFVENYIQIKNESKFESLNNDHWESEIKAKNEYQKTFVNCEVQYSSMSLYNHQFDLIFNVFERDLLYKLNWKQIDYAYDFTCNDVEPFIEQVFIDKKVFKDMYFKPRACGTHHYTSEAKKFYIKIYDSSLDKEKKAKESKAGIHYYNLYNEKKYHTCDKWFNKKITRKNRNGTSYERVIPKGLSDLDYCESIMRLELSIKRDSIDAARKEMNKNVSVNNELFSFSEISKSLFQNIKMFYDSETITPFIKYLKPYIESILFGESFKINNEKIHDNLKNKFTEYMTDEIHQPMTLKKIDVDIDGLIKQSAGCIRTATAHSTFAKYPLYDKENSNDQVQLMITKSATRLYELLETNFNDKNIDEDLFQIGFRDVVDELIIVTFDKYMNDDFQKAFQNEIAKKRVEIFSQTLSELGQKAFFNEVIRNQLRDNKKNAR
jgi:hypothetical protein